MSTPNRTAQLNKIYKAIKKHGKPIVHKGEEPLMDSLLFASCLENAAHDVAEQVYNTVKSSFFDWNEVRVSSVKELSEVMAALPDPTAAATSMKGVLQSVFESDYSFDLEALKKQNLGAAIKRLQKLDKVTPFIVAYATQVALGGHSIPLDKGALGVLYVLGAITEAEARTGNVSGLERAIPKSKGQEFGSLLHQVGAEFVANPFAPAIREYLVSIEPAAKERLPKRTPKKPPEPPKPEPVATNKKKGPEKPPAKGAEKAAPAAAAKKKDAAPEPKKPAAPVAKSSATDNKKKLPKDKKKSPGKQLSRQKPR